MRLFITFLIVFANTLGLMAQKQDRVYSVFILNFAKYVQWPADKAAGDFVIGVMGSPVVSEELKTVCATKSIGNQKIVIKDCHSILDTSGCHMVFVGDSKSSMVHDIISKLSSDPTLLITEKSGLATKGGGISFLLADGKVRFEINKNAIERKGMKVASALINLATVVED